MAGALLSIAVEDGALSDYVTVLKKEEKQIMKAVYRGAFAPIKRMTVNEAKRVFKSGQLFKGVRFSAWKSARGASVYIRKPYDEYYKLLFFEGGTSNRTAKKGRGRRGNIQARWFFKKSVDTVLPKVPDLFQAEFAKQIDRVAKRANQTGRRHR